LHGTLIAAVLMGIRFDKVLEQVAGAGHVRSEASHIESRERKVRRLEDIIRAKEAMGDRIVMCLGLALSLSAIGLPVYAFHFSDGYAYLQSAGSGTLVSGTVASQSRPVDLSPATTGSLNREARNTAPSQRKQAEAGAGASDGRTRFQRYVIHRATSESALIEGPEGLWWVTPGMTLPGIGQVLSIERSDSGWSVLTSETMIIQPSARSL
jgi:hypothetical protein